MPGALKIALESVKVGIMATVLKTKDKGQSSRKQQSQWNSLQRKEKDNSFFQPQISLKVRVHDNSVASTKLTSNVMNIF